jgi:hypothetical protein
MSIRHKISRRTLIQGAVLAGAALTPWRQPAAQQKILKQAAKYQDQPKGQQRCEICVNFQPPNQCRMVQGRIAKNGWCQLFAARENAH